MSGTPKEPKEAKPGRLSKISGRRALIMFVILALAALSGLLVYKYIHAQNEVTRLSNPQESAKEETRQLTAKVGRLVEIPTNETPTIATVSDVTKLQSQAFYANAKNGDKVLIFNQARKAFLYRPSTDKLIEIAPINIGNSATTDQSSTGLAQ